MKKQKLQSGKITQIGPGIVLIIFVIFLVAIVTNTPDNSIQTNNNTVLGTTQVKEKFTLEENIGSYDGFAFYIKGTIKNNTEKTYSYVQVSFNLYDETGAQVGTAMDNINNLEGNGVWKFEAIGMGATKATKYKLVGINGW